MKKLITLKELILITLADGIAAAAVFFFQVPSRTAVSSITGLAVVLTNAIPLPVSVITLILNVFLLILGFFLVGSEFGFKTVYGTLMLSVYLAVFEKLLPGFTSLTGSQELDVLCYILSISFACSLLFNMNASSGGLDIVGKIMNKYLHMDIGKAMSIAGAFVAFTSIFFCDSKTVVLSFLGTYFNGIILDQFIFGQNIKRRVCIMSPKMEEIREFITVNLHSGATLYESIGAYKMERRMELITIVDRQEYQKLMAFMRKTDPNAFITVYNVNSVQYTVKP